MFNAQGTIENLCTVHLETECMVFSLVFNSICNSYVSKNLIAYLFICINLGCIYQQGDANK